MSGEILGAAGALTGKIVADSVKEIRQADAAVRKELVSEATKTTAFKQAANTRAKRIAVKEALFLQLFRPIRGLIGLSAEYFENNFDEDMRERIEAIPENRRVAPKPIVAAPAMQGLAFSLDEPDLKELYLNLLASASDDRKRDTVHPSFAEIIRQLTGEEASLLRHPLGNSAHVAIARVRGTTSGRGGRTLANHLLPLADSDTGEMTVDAEVPTYVDNWMRLGLVDVEYGTYLVRGGAYDFVAQRPEYLKLEAEYANADITLKIEQGILRPTEFGMAFGRAVGMRDQP
ncbi:DUF4393 domain-containing protein [Paenarthrobacter nitroguajacolicus]|uniref:DUF4393 domain-containing protein n=1 Tax=Paenarthrobacter nitroguajacolicus TaxID=211146 RepID=UPI00248B3349|nr:DUF4393 domain-containing protein [Paenarthrobacter nitroguajacolicus]MDI2037257.1 hypothetical protein [Paenarthrobacter nitroguajacolicus]